MDEIVKGWLQDPEFRRLGAEQQRSIVGHHFDTDYADDEFRALAADEQARVREYFLAQSGLKPPAPPPPRMAQRLPTQRPGAGVGASARPVQTRELATDPELPENRRMRELSQGPAARLAGDLEQGMLQVNLGRLRSRQVYDGDDTPEVRNGIANIKAQIRPPAENVGTVESFLGSAFRMLPTMGATMWTGAKAGAKELLQHPEAPAPAFARGFQLSAAMEMGRIEAGLAYDELLELRDDRGNAIDPKVARLVAGGVGAVNGLIEVAQIGWLAKAFPGAQSVATRAIARGLAKLGQSGALKAAAARASKVAGSIAGRNAIKFGEFLAGEVAQEVTQESANIVGAFVAAEMDAEMNAAGIPELQRAAIIERLKETAVESAKAFVVIGAPGAAVSVGHDVQHSLKNPGEEASTPEDIILGRPAGSAPPSAPPVGPDGGTRRAPMRMASEAPAADSFMPEAAAPPAVSPIPAAPPGPGAPPAAPVSAGALSRLAVPAPPRTPADVALDEDDALAGADPREVDRLAAQAEQEKQAEVAIQANDAATSLQNDRPEPTEGQKKAGNYKKGHINVLGFDITVENPAGSTRSGKAPDGTEWEVEMQDHYGYFRRSLGKDGDQVDVFLGPAVNTPKAFVIDQMDPNTGEFDEHKVILGAANAQQAREIYQRNYEEGWNGFGGMTEMEPAQLKAWLGDGTRKRTPLDPSVPVKAVKSAATVGGMAFTDKEAAALEAAKKADALAKANSNGETARKVAAGLGIEFNGVDPAAQYLFTDPVTGDTFAVSKLGDAHKRLAELRAKKGVPAPAPEALAVPQAPDGLESILDEIRKKGAEQRAKEEAEARTGAEPEAQSGAPTPSTDSTPEKIPKPKRQRAKQAPITVRGWIKKMGGINPVNMAAEFKEAAVAVKMLLRKNGTPYDKIETALKSEGYLLEGENLLDLLIGDHERAKEVLKRRNTDITARSGDDLTHKEKQLLSQMEYEPEDPPPGEYVQVNAEDLPEGRPLTIIAGHGPDGWDIYKIIDKDPFGVTLQDGTTVELAPFDRVDVLKSDLEGETKPKMENGPGEAPAETNAEAPAPEAPEAPEPAAAPEPGKPTLDLKQETHGQQRPKPLHDSRPIKSGHRGGKLGPDDYFSTPSSRDEAQPGLGFQNPRQPDLFAGGERKPEATPEKIPGTKAVAQRMLAGEERFIESVMEQFGKTREEAERVLARFKETKLVHIDSVTGQYQLKTGASWEQDVIDRAAAEPKKPRHLPAPAPVEIKGGLGDPAAFFGLSPKQRIRALLKLFGDVVRSRGERLNKVGLQQVVARALGVERGPLLADSRYNQKFVEEVFEGAIAAEARRVIDAARAEGFTVAETFAELQRLYEWQPNLATRTSTSTINQAYSTPVHLGYLLQELAGVTRDATVYEPAAGTGMLLTAASQHKAHANEINLLRSEILRAMGFTASQEDGATLNAGRHDPNERDADAVVANPPFGAIPTVKVDGYNVSQIDHRIMADALRAMKDDGRAAFIIGGHNLGSNGQIRHAPFFNWLHHFYNVTHNVEVDGQLYSRQGTKYDFRIIVIDGRKAEPGGAAPDSGFLSASTPDELLNLFGGLADATVASRGVEALSRGEAPAGGVGGGETADRGNLPDGPPNQGAPDDRGPGGAQGPRGGGAVPGQAGGRGDARGAAGRASDQRPVDAPGPGPDTLPPRGDDAGERPGQPAGEGAGPRSADTRADEKGNGGREPGGVPAGERGPDALGGILDQIRREGARQREKEAAEKAAADAAKAQADFDRLANNLNDLLDDPNFSRRPAEAIADDDPRWLKVREILRQMWEATAKLAATVAERASLFITQTYAKLKAAAEPYLLKFAQADIAAALEAEKQQQERKDEVPGGADAYQAPYVPRSKGPVVDETLVPRKMAQDTQAALEALEARVGDIDRYVASRLDYKSTKALWDALSADQVDAVALAIDNIERGYGMIIGDQTGVGKGRVAASLYRYARLQGLKPIFFTEKPNLFSDFYRDIRDIGQKVFKPFLMASNRDLANIVDEDGEVVIPTPGLRERAGLLKAGDDAAVARAMSPHDGILSTYSQVRQPNDAQTVLILLARDNIMILDESHNASGESATGEFVRGALAEVRGVAYLSATFAKRPDTMPVYFRTAIGTSNMQMEQLIDAISAGGTPLQEWVSAALAKMGQYIRREKSFKGIEIRSHFDTANRERDARRADEATAILREILEVDRLVADSLADAIRTIKNAKPKDLRKAKKVVIGGVEFDPIGIRPGSKRPVRASVNTANFASTVHNKIRQLLLAMKADAAVEAAIEELKAGRKPIIAVANTMESFVTDLVNQGMMRVGDRFDLNFGNILERALRRTLRVSITTPQGEEIQVDLDPAELGEKLEEAFDTALEMIRNSRLDVPGSPIDHIRRKLKEAGYSSEEITGRGYVADIENPVPTLRLRTGKERSDRKGIIHRFNSGALDVVIINSAGSTGISMHASPKFTDQRPRVYIGVQAELNVDTEVQKMGRINRKGQTALPSYRLLFLDLPTEIRPAAVLSRKLKSLSANTSANADSPVSQKELPDMLNRYGDLAAAEWVRQHGIQLPSGEWQVPGMKGIRLNPDGGIVQISGRVGVQSIAMQEQFWEWVEGAYKDTIEWMKEIGTFDLEVGEYDFKAKTLSRTTLNAGRARGPNNVFTLPTTLEQVEVVSPTKPYKIARIQEMVDEELAGKSPQEYSRGLIDRLRKELAEYLGTEIARINSEFSQEPGEDGVSPAASQIARLRGRTDEQFQKIERMLSRRFLGKPYIVSGVEGAPDMHAVLVKVRLAKAAGSPVAPGRVRLVFAVNSPMRTLSLPISKIDAANLFVLDTSEAVLRSWDSAAALHATERRHILTGNLLDAYSHVRSQARLVRFTREDGSWDMGVLAPRNFKADKVDTRVALDPEMAVRAALLGMRISSGSVEVMRDADDLLVTVPKSKSLGARFYQDQDLLALAEGGEFQSSANYMSAAFPAKNTRRVVERIIALGEVFKVSQADFKVLSSHAADTTLREPEATYLAEPKSIGMRPMVQASLDFSGKAKDGEPKAPTFKRPTPLVRMATSGDIAAAGNVIFSVDDAASLLAHIRKEAQEHMMVVVVDSQGLVLEVQRYTVGTHGSSQFNLAELTGRVLNIPGAAKAYIAHNHPGGTTGPSSHDIAMANHVRAILALRGIDFETFVIAGTNYESFSDGIVTSNSRSIRPTVRRARVPIVRRVLKSTADRGPGITGPDEMGAWIRAAGDPEGFILLDNLNRPVGVVPKAKGMPIREFAAEVVAGLEATNASGMVYSSRSEIKAGTPELDAVRSIRSMMQYTARMLDVYERGVSAASTTGLDRFDDKIAHVDIAAQRANDERPLFLLGRRPKAKRFARLNKAEAESAARKVMDGWRAAPGLVVVAQQSELPEGILAKSKGDIVDAAYWRGKVYVVAENVENPAHLATAVLHEAFGHHGLRIALPAPEIISLLDAIYRGNREAVGRIGKDYGFDTATPKGQRLAADEWFARQAQELEGYKLWLKRAAAAVARMMRRLGFSINEDDARIRQALLDARKAVIEGSGAVASGWGAAPAFSARGRVAAQAEAGPDWKGALPPEVVQREAAARGIPKAALLDNLRDWGRVLVHQAHHFPHLQTVKNRVERARLNDILRRHQEVPSIAKQQALEMISSWTRGLSQSEYELFRVSVITADLLRDLESGLYSAEDGAERPLPFGYANHQELRDTFQRLKDLAGDHPKVVRALEARQESIRDMTRRLVEAKQIKRENLGNGDYYHHQVIQYWAMDRGIQVGSKDVRTKWRPWKAARTGSQMDYNTEYVEAEFMALASQIAQLETVETLRHVKAESDIFKALVGEAKQRNLANLWAKARREGWVEHYPPGHEREGEEIDILLPWKQKIAMARAKLAKMAERGELDFDSEWDDLVDELAQDPDMDHPRWFQFLSYLIDKQKPGANWAATIFKAIRERNQFIESTLGDEFLTWQKVLAEREGYVEWKPDPGKGWFWTSTITDKVLQQIAAGFVDPNEAETRRLLARGRDTIWVIPEGLAATLDEFYPPSDKSEVGIGRFGDWAMSAWKQYILLNPYSLIKYNLNNTSGDVDVCLAYNPAILKYAGRAFKDLRQWQGRDRAKLPPAVAEELELALRLGVIGSGWAVQEVQDVFKILKTDRLIGDILLDERPNWFNPKTYGDGYWRMARGVTTLRENVLRLAAFRYFRDNNDKRLYGASRREEVDAIEDRDEKAAKLARELLGDYGNISKTGGWLRKRLIPFYAWLEINAPRYAYMMCNTRYEDREPGAVALRTAGVAGKKAAFSAAKLALRAGMLYGAVMLWNMLFFGDEEEELAAGGRDQLHLILGRNEDGTIRSIRFQGALSDALSFFGLEDFPQDVKDVMKGKSTILEKLIEAPKALTNRMFQGIRPDLKTAAEAVAGQRYFPDVWRPTPIRDTVRHILQTFKLERIYDEVTGQPRRSDGVAAHLWGDLKSLLIFESDPGEMAYFTTRKLVFDYLREQGLERPDAKPTKKGNALYFYKKALRYGDMRAAEKYLQKYYQLGGRPKQIKESIQKAHPLAGVPERLRHRFRQSLSPGDAATVARAMEWYRMAYGSNPPN
jgi:DNA repair protein RadC/predicted RNA methylase